MAFKIKKAFIGKWYTFYPKLPWAGMGKSLFGKRGLVCVAVGFAAEDGEEDDFYVEPEGPVFQVVDVALYTFLDGGVATPAIHLGPAGDAGFHEVANFIGRNIFFKFFDKVFSFGPWTYNTHVFDQDIQELREFINYIYFRMYKKPVSFLPKSVRHKTGG